MEQPPQSAYIIEAQHHVVFPVLKLHAGGEDADVCVGELVAKQPHLPIKSPSGVESRDVNLTFIPRNVGIFPEESISSKTFRMLNFTPVMKSM